MQLVRGMNTSRRSWNLKEIEAKAWRNSDDWSWVHKVGLAGFYADSTPTPGRPGLMNSLLTWRRGQMTPDSPRPSMECMLSWT
jgi:hypothetical protein